MNLTRKNDPTRISGLNLRHDLMNIIPALETGVESLSSDNSEWRENGKKICRMGIDRLRAIVGQLDEFNAKSGEER